MNLYQLQQEIAAALNANEGNANAPSYLKEKQPLTATQRLAIYRHSMQSGLLQALIMTYPVCKKIVGEDFFAAMVHQYQQQTPSNSPDIDCYGETLSTFIRDFPPAAELTYLADVARLEWAWHRASQGGDFAPFDANTLWQVSDEKQGAIIFLLPPHSTLLNSPYPILRIWRANQENDAPDEEIDLASGGNQLIIHRRHHTVCMDELNDHQWLILSAIQKGLPVEELCERFAEIPSAVNIADQLAECVRKGWIANFSFNSS